MLQIRITNTVFESGRAKYLAGKLYPITDDTKRQVALNNGAEVDEPTDEELAAQQAAQAEAEAEARAAEAAAQAQAEAAKEVPAAEAAAAVAPASKRAR